MRGLSGKNAIVTGAGGAIGRAISRRLAEEGCVLSILDKDGDAAAATVRSLTEAGGRAFASVADITSYEAIARAVADFEREAGPTDILINNAGWDRVGAFLESDPASWEKLIAINLRGPLTMHHVVVRGMAERRRGKV